jgi:hypothetical protein
VHLPQVDVVGAEAFEAGVERGEQVAAGRVSVALLAAAADRLGRDDDVLAIDHALQHPADDSLALTVDVDVGGVDQRAARLDERLRLRGRVVLVGVAAPGHRSEREPGDEEAGRTQPSLLHAGHGIRLICVPMTARAVCRGRSWSRARRSAIVTLRQ